VRVAAGDPHPSRMSLLSIRDFQVSFATDFGRQRVVENLSLDIAAGEALGLVGESGCGKSVTAMSIVRLLPSPPSFIDGGSVRLAGQELTTLDERQLRALRGDRVGVIFQEPMTSLNPTLSVGYQLVEALRLHRSVSLAEARTKALERLQLVGVSAPERRLEQYPHELSGGLRQRVMIAMALMCDPVLLIADEPTTALDVTIQAQVLELLEALRDELGMALLMITHDLGVVAEFCQRVVVMYAGRVVESADVRTLFATPRHPYTHGLMQSMPSLNHGKGRLPSIPGVVPDVSQRPPGCRFSTRCARAEARCHQHQPELQETNGHAYACWNPVT